MTRIHKLGLSIFGALALLSAPASAESGEGKVLHIRGGGTYLEIRMNTRICSSSQISSDWGERPRIEYGNQPEIAESVQALATAAMLSGKNLKVSAQVQGSGSSARCHLSSVILMN